MNPTLSGIIDRVKSTAKTVGYATEKAAENTARQAGEWYEQNRLSTEAAALNREIGRLYREIGRIIYNTHRGEEPSEGVIDLLLSEIDEKKVKIAELNARSESVKKRKLCSSCGKSCARDDAFCRACGQQFE